MAGNGGPSRLFGLPVDVHYHRHSMAVSVTISTPQGPPFCAEGRFCKAWTCVACLYVHWRRRHLESKPQIIYRRSSPYRDQYGASEREGEREL